MASFDLGSKVKVFTSIHRSQKLKNLKSPEYKYQIKAKDSSITMKGQMTDLKVKKAVLHRIYVQASLRPND